jgi:ribonuclease P protein subunit POP4
MMRKPENLIRHELIGLHVTIASSKGKTIERVHGRVIDETKNTIKVENDKKVRGIIKDGCVFRFTIPETGAVTVVDGKELVGRPEDRIKRK